MTVSVLQINWCSHYGVLHPWVSILTPAHVNIITEDLHKLQVSLSASCPCYLSIYQSDIESINQPINL